MTVLPNTVQFLGQPSPDLYLIKLFFVAPDHLDKCSGCDIHENRTSVYLSLTIPPPPSSAALSTRVQRRSMKQLVQNTGSSRK